MKKATLELKETLESYKADVKANNDPSNHWLRRFFRCWIDGSYKGEAHYRANCKYIRENKDNAGKMTQFVICEMVNFLHAEFSDISPTTIRKTVIGVFSKKELEALNKELIDDSMDLIRG